MKNLKKTGSSVIGLSMLFLSLSMSNCKDETPKVNLPKDTSKVINDCKSCVEIFPEYIEKNYGKIGGVIGQISKKKFYLIKDTGENDAWFLKTETGYLYFIKCDFPQNLLKENKEVVIDGTEYFLNIDPTIKQHPSKSICVSKIY